MRRFHFWSQFVHISPSDGAKNCLREAKNENRFSKSISRLRTAMVFLIADLESASKVTSIGMFFGKITHFYEELGTKSCFWPKSCFCCSRTACNGLEKTKPAVGLEMFESTPHYLESCFFFILCEPLPSDKSANIHVVFCIYSKWVYNTTKMYQTNAKSSRTVPKRGTTSWKRW